MFLSPTDREVLNCGFPLSCPRLMVVVHARDTSERTHVCVQRKGLRFLP